FDFRQDRYWNLNSKDVELSILFKKIKNRTPADSLENSIQNNSVSLSESNTNFLSRATRLDNLVHLYLRFHIAAGWVLTSALVVSLTGIIQNSKD
ncbi:MAG: hypothetical protein AAFW67_11235, partial [Cyanobacteria bacterium J06638_38]